MLTEVSQLTPHQLLEKFGLVIPKPEPDKSLVNATIDNLPVTNRTCLTIHGYGDWARGRSTGGSVVLAAENYVLKVQLGEQRGGIDVLTSAKEKALTAREFFDVSPATAFFIAQVDGLDQPSKVIVYQAKNHGKPACHTPINRLLLPEVTHKFANIIDNVIKVLLERNLLDYGGIHMDCSNILKKFVVGIIRRVPWYSDNMMVDENNRTELVDNIPSLESRQIFSPFEKHLNILRLRFSKNLLLISSKIYSLVGAKIKL